MDVQLINLEPSGNIPNHPHLPLLHYRTPFRAQAASADAEGVVAHLARSGWGGAWVNGIFTFHHYHARAHEVLVNVGDAVEVQFGGRDGPKVTFAPGEAVLLPAGTGHYRLSSPSRLVIVGAYPAGQEDWDLKRANREDFEQALGEIAAVGLPQRDPIFGTAEAREQYWPAQS